MTHDDRLHHAAAWLVEMEELAEAELAAFRQRVTGQHEEAQIAAAEAQLRASMQTMLDEYRSRAVRWLLEPHAPSVGLQ